MGKNKYLLFLILILISISTFSCTYVSDYGDTLWHNTPVTKTFSSGDEKDSSGYYRHYFSVYSSGEWEIDITSSSDAAFSIYTCEENLRSDYEYGYFYKTFNCTQKYVATFHIVISCHEDMLDLNPEYTINVKLK